MLDTYQLNLAGLILACGILLALPSSADDKNLSHNHDKSPAKGKKSNTNGKGTQWAFFTAYALVMGSDWLQGPFLYSLYQDEHRIRSLWIPHLFTAGFVSGAITAPYIGTLADRYGRRQACLIYCLAAATSCLLTAYATALSFGSDDAKLTLLFVGRGLGGFATSLLFSVFESWMVADFRSRYLDEKGCDLFRTFGRMSTVNSVVAIVAGVVSEWLVGVTGTKKAPFVASVGLLGVASVVIWTQWDENYGVVSASAEKASPSSKSHDHAQGSAKGKQPEQKQDLYQILATKKVASLMMASTIFEGSMYLFVVCWAPAMQHSSTQPDQIPYGLIFASFMCATLLSSLFYPSVTRRLSQENTLAAVLGTAAVSFLLLSYVSGTPAQGGQLLFWLFCIFEATVGAYFPASGVMKGDVVPDHVRAQVYAVMRVPLNVFVVFSLAWVGSEGLMGSASSVFGLCGTLMLGGAGAVWLISH